MIYSVTTEIKAEPDTVWGVMSDIERWPEWTPGVTSVRRHEPGPLAVGNQTTIRQPRLPPARWTVTELENGRSFTWISRSPGILVTARHRVDPAGRGSQATLSISFDGLLGVAFGWLTRGITQRYLSLEAAGLKACSEERRFAAGR